MIEITHSQENIVNVEKNRVITTLLLNLQNYNSIIFSLHIYLSFVIVRNWPLHSNGINNLEH